ncbi:MAG: DUF3999 family protein, partial [Burkholderiales bacterium]|nr:DUF3999 family protein [Burkholderiales bacterium]
AAEPRAMHIDLGGVLPLARLELNLPPGSTTVMPLRVQQRNRVDEAWQTVAQGVAYRIERGDGAADRSPPLALGNLRARYLRLLPDERAPAFDAARTEAVVELRLATLVFAAQGRAPYRLLAGAAGTQATGALTPEALVPKLDQERPRFGAATLGAFSEVAEVAQAAQRAETVALWRPRLLWAVLLAGVAGLGWMVWRLAVQRGGAGR